MENNNLIKEAIQMVKDFAKKHEGNLKHNDKLNNEIFLETLNKMLDDSVKYDKKTVDLTIEYIKALDKIYSI